MGNLPILKNSIYMIMIRRLCDEELFARMPGVFFNWAHKILGQIKNPDTIYNVVSYPIKMI